MNDSQFDSQEAAMGCRRQTAENIGRQVSKLKAIAEEQDLDFLSYILKLAVLETEVLIAQEEKA